MIILYIIATLYGIMLTTWLYYLAVMNMSRNKDKITLPAKFFAYPILYIGLVWDVIMNATIGTICFLELPKEWLFTPRCSRHIKDTGWRGKMAKFWCSTFLNPFDPSDKHC